MNQTHVSKLLFGLVPATCVIILVLIIIIFYYFSRTRTKSKLDKVATVEEEEEELQDLEKQKTPPPQKETAKISEETLTTTTEEDLMKFNGGEDLTVFDILDAPGEVIGKSSYGTLYKAALERSNMIRLLRFIRPIACTSEKFGGCDFESVVRLLGSVRHSNLVPLLAFYAGPRGEKLLVHPFYRFGNLTQFIEDGNGESHKWAVIYRISLGIARGMDHLHNGLPNKPIIHGNLKSRNILLDRNYEPFASDFGLHILLNPSASQEMLETLASEGYAAPELIKMKDANKETDIYSLGVILLELLSGKEVVNKNPTPSQDLYLPIIMRNAILDRRISDLFHPDVLLSQTSDGGQVTEERILLFFQLAMACCSPSPSLRPNIKQIVRKLEEIGG